MARTSMPARLSAALLCVALFGGLLGACASDDDEEVRPGQDDTSATDGGAGGAGAPGAQVALQITDSGSSAVLSRDDELLVELETNPSTGYSWTELTPLDTKVLTLESDDVAPSAVRIDPEAGPAVGAPSTQLFVFRSAGEGDTRISLGYVPPGGGPPEQTFELGVQVLALRDQTAYDSFETLEVEPGGTDVERSGTIARGERRDAYVVEAPGGTGETLNIRFSAASGTGSGTSSAPLVTVYGPADEQLVAEKAAAELQLEEPGQYLIVVSTMGRADYRISVGVAVNAG